MNTWMVIHACFQILRLKPASYNNYPNFIINYSMMEMATQHRFCVDIRGGGVASRLVDRISRLMNHAQIRDHQGTYFSTAVSSQKNRNHSS